MSSDREEVRRVVVIDLDIPFLRMVIFMVKWAFASIPAMVIVWSVLGVIFAGFAAFSGTLLAWTW